jgi:hypothetical protein
VVGCRFSTDLEDEECFYRHPFYGMAKDLMSRIFYCESDVSVRNGGFSQFSDYIVRSKKSRKLSCSISCFKALHTSGFNRTVGLIAVASFTLLKNFSSLIIDSGASSITFGPIDGSFNLASGIPLQVLSTNPGRARQL